MLVTRAQAMWLTLAMLLAISPSTTSLAGSKDKRLDIYWIDSEGGGSTLIVSPLGESLLVDTGNPGRRDPERIVQVVTAAAGLRKIDHLVTTHYHVDHFGGAAQLSEMLPIGQVHDNGDFEGLREPPDEAYKKFKADGRSVISPGDEIGLKQSDDKDALKLSVHCLAARQKFIELVKTADAKPNECCADQKTKPVDNSDNANSIVLLVSFGPFRFFDGGDLTWNMEQKLVCPVNHFGKVDVFQVMHHGLDASNNPVLIRSLEPTVAVMNNGSTKGCEPNTFATLKETKSIQAIYQLHKNLRPDGSVNNAPDETIANLDKECKANHVKLSVDPSGKTYTISIPAKGHERTFQTR